MKQYIWGSLLAIFILGVTWQLATGLTSMAEAWTWSKIQSLSAPVHPFAH